jgi:hypothetical protein
MRGHRVLNLDAEVLRSSAAPVIDLFLASSFEVGDSAWVCYELDAIPPLKDVLRPESMKSLVLHGGFCG